jgi:hypothetical protein
MNDLERLYLLRDLLCDPELSMASSLGELANQIESLLSTIEVVPGGLNLAYSKLWGALEILGVQHQEAGTVPTGSDLAELGVMIDFLSKEVEAEIAARVVC